MNVVFERRVFACAMDFSGTDDLYFYKLREDTATWVEVHKDAGQYFTKAALYGSFNPLIILVFDGATPEMAYISVNRGETWAAFPTSRTYYCFLPAAIDLIYAADNNKLYLSIDFGGSWTEVWEYNTGATGGPIEIIRYPGEGANPARFVIVHDEGSVFWADEGDWTPREVATGLAAITKVLVNGNVLIAFTDETCVTSVDRGETWGVGVELVPYKYFMDGVFSGRIEKDIIIACSDTMVMSYDNGLTWRIGKTMAGTLIHSIAHSRNYELFGVNETYGKFYRMRDYGEIIDEYTFLPENTDIKARSLLHVGEKSGIVGDSAGTIGITGCSDGVIAIKRGSGRE